MGGSQNNAEERLERVHLGTVIMVQKGGPRYILEHWTMQEDQNMEMMPEERDKEEWEASYLATVGMATPVEEVVDEEAITTMTQATTATTPEWVVVFVAKTVAKVEEEG